MESTTNSIDFFIQSDLNDHEEGDFSDLDAKFAEELQLQEALLSSATTSHPHNIVANEIGQSSISFCEICLERKENDKILTVKPCLHSFCFVCVNQYVTTKTKEKRSEITCPGVHCGSILELDDCRSFLEGEVIGLWGEAMCEELFRSSEKIYCPFKDCSTMYVNGDEGGDDVVIREAVCLACQRMFCAKCGVPWHPEIGCEEYEKSDEKVKDDVLMSELAEEKKWVRCPQCKFFVERMGGCPHMTCRCGLEFCYGCGEEWTDDHGGCQGN